MKHLRAYLPLLILVVIGIAVLASGVLEQLEPDHLVAGQAALKSRIATHPLVAAAIYIVAMTIAVATGLPGSVALVLGGGMWFGIAWGTFLSAIGLMAGATILFLASRVAFSHGSGSAPVLVDRVRAGYLAYPVSYTMFLRLVPFFPFGAVTVALAWLRCPLWLFLVTSTIGGSVMLSFETALGAGLARSYAHDGRIAFSLLNHPGVILPLVGMATLSLIPIVLGRLRKRSDRAPTP